MLDEVIDDLVKAIERLDVHDHLCLIYESREEQLAAVIPFMRDGLERGERCIYVADDNTVEVVEEAMRAGGIDVGTAIRTGALSVITKRDSYLKEGSFDPDRMISFLKDAVASSKTDGYSALRVTGEMTWMLAGDPGSERLMEYEAKLNYFFPEYDCLAICQYNRKKFDPESIKRVIQTHPLVIFGATVCRSYYYIPPDEFLQAEELHASVEVDRMLAGLVGRERAEEAIRKREERLRYIYSQSPIAIEYYNTDGLLVDANQACLDMFGVDNVLEVKGFNLFEDPNLIDDFKIKLRAGETVQYESEFDFGLVGEKSLYRTSKKGRIFIHSYMTPLKTETGNIYGYLVHVQEISERVKAEKALQARERQHAALAELGQKCLEEEDLAPLLQKAVALTVQALDVELCKVLELAADADCFLLRAGVGWKDGLVGHATVHAGTESQAGYTLLSEEPVIVEDFATEARFSAPPLLRDHGVVSGISVIIRCGDHPFGVLGVHTNRRRLFTKDDVSFVRAVANILAMAIERKRSEEAYRTLVDNSLQGLAIIQDGIAVFANNALAEMTGYAVEEILSFSLRQLEQNLYPDDRKNVLRYMQAVYAGKTVESGLEARFIRKDGDVIWTQAIMNLTEFNGKPALQAVYIDITQRKLSEQELLEAHRLLETIFDHTHMMVALLDSQLNIIKVNRAYADADDKEPSFYTGKKHFDLFPNKENEEIFKRVVDTGEPHFAIARPFQYTEHPERGVSYWDWSLVPIKDEDGAVASLVLTLLNVTERVLSQEAIIRSEEKYRSLFEETRDGIIIITPEGRIEDINPAGVEMLGYSSVDEMLQLGTALDLYQRKEDYDLFISTLRQQEFVKNYEMDMKRKDGRQLVASVTVSASKNEQGKIVSYKGIIRDLTAHRQLERELLQAQKMESIGQLAGGIAHDFNNYLTAIHGYIDLAAMDLPEGNPANENLIEARASSERAANLSRQLLLFSSRERINLKPVDLNRVLSDLLKMLGRVIGEQYEIKVELADELRIINADAGLLEQVLMNLVVNARDAMPQGGIITISTGNVLIEPGFVKAKLEKTPREFVELEVSDNGMGMDAGVLSHIFEPFFSTKGTGKGTGLGLSVVYGIITQHGGWIDVDSTPGTGTTFKIYFPAERISLVEEKPDEIPVGEINGHGEGILLVEDDEDIRKMANRSLVDHGYQVFQSPDAESALALFETEVDRIDLVFSDIVLPGQDGVQLVDNLKKRKPGLEVLLASGYSEAMDQQAISDSGYRLMHKPYSLTELLKAIHEMVSR